MNAIAEKRAAKKRRAELKYIVTLGDTVITSIVGGILCTLDEARECRNDIRAARVLAGFPGHCVRVYKLTEVK